MDFKHDLHNGDKIAIAAVIFSIIIGAAIYPFLPDQIASHWNTDGIADDFVNKELFTISFPLLIIIVYLLLSLLPKAKELHYEMELLHRHYAELKASAVTFLAYVYLVILYSNTATSALQVSTPQLLFPGLSILLYYLATVMPKLKRNHLIGIRTPWTIHNDEVWHKTHLLAAKLFKALSVIVMFATLIAVGISTWLAIIPIVAVGIFLVIYSYALSRKAQKKHVQFKKRDTHKKAKKRK